MTTRHGNRAIVVRRDRGSPSYRLRHAARDAERAYERGWHGRAVGREAEPLKAAAEALVHALMHSRTIARWQHLRPGWNYFVGDKTRERGWWYVDHDEDDGAAFRMVFPLASEMGRLMVRYGGPETRQAIKAALGRGRRGRPPKVHVYAKAALAPYLPVPGAPGRDRQSTFATFRRVFTALGIERPDIA